MAETKEDIADAQRDLDEMEAMLSAYLDFAHGAGQGAQEDIDVSAFISGIAADESIEATISGPVATEGRPQQLRRAVLNLIYNARKYAGDPALSLETTESHVLIHVDDSGPGIPEHKREEVLRPFARLDDARTQNVEGVGLGLAVARDIAQVHGGRLKLSDSPAGGLRATIQLPR